MDFNQPVTLGRTDLTIGRLIVSSGYRLPGEAVREAFDRGLNCFHFSARRDPGFIREVGELARAERDRVVVALQAYSRWGPGLEKKVDQLLGALGIEALDLLILGYWQRRPYGWVTGRALDMKRRGKVRYLGFAGHKRKVFPDLAAGETFDILMPRYNAAHRGAEQEIFERLPEAGGPGVLSYTSTRWGQLLDPKKTPAGQRTPSAADCYRFALSHPAVDAVFFAPATMKEFDQGVAALDSGPMGEGELAWMRRVGDHVHR